VTLPVRLVGRCTTTSAENNASITSRGALVVAPYAYDLSSFNELDTDNVPKNFYKPEPHKRFVVTGIIATADKEVGANDDATITVYEASSTTSTVQDKIILEFVLTQSTVVSLLPLNIIVSEGKFVNGVTDKDDVHMNVMGYFVPGAED